ncbi:MAG: PaaI family thioesterase [Rhodovibrionaceae bacterium]
MAAFDGTKDIPVSQLVARVMGRVPHCEELGIVAESFAPPSLTMRLPYQDKLVFDSDSGILHGGAVTTLVDTTAGMVAMAAVKPERSVATLDLRLDYLRPGLKGCDILCTAEVYHVTKLIVFVRAQALQADDGREIASALGTFMATGGGA